MGFSIKYFLESSVFLVKKKCITDTYTAVHKIYFNIFLFRINMTNECNYSCLKMFRMENFKLIFKRFIYM